MADKFGFDEATSSAKFVQQAAAGSLLTQGSMVDGLDSAPARHEQDAKRVANGTAKSSGTQGGCVDKVRFINLKDVCNINMGQSPASDSYNDNEDGIPFFQGNADFGEKYPTTRKWCNAPTKIAQAGDILISVRAPIGALNYAKEECCIGRGLAAITPNLERVSVEFIYWLLKDKNKELNLQGTGSTFKAISRKVLEEIKVPDIELKKQKELAGNLEKVYSVIQVRKHQIEELDTLIRARFVEFFGNPLKNEKGWEKKRLKDVCTKLNDGTHFSPESYEQGDYKYITAKNIKISGFDFSNITYVSEEVHKPIYARCNPELGDVLYIKDGVTTGIAMVNSLREEFTLLSSVALLKQNREILNGYFLCGVLNNTEMYNDIRGNMGGAAITRLTIAKLNEIMIILPPLALQNQFSDFVQATDKLKVEVQKSLDEFQTVFDSLMQQYFG